MTLRHLRRYVAQLSLRRHAATTTARKLASMRAFFRCLREHGRIAQNPAELLSAPKRPAQLPRVLKRGRGRGAARPDPGIERARAA